MILKKDMYHRFRPIVPTRREVLLNFLHNGIGGTADTSNTIVHEGFCYGSRRFQRPPS